MIFDKKAEAVILENDYIYIEDAFRLNSSLGKEKGKVKIEIN